MPMDFEFKV